MDRPGRSGARLSVGILGFRAAVLVVAVSVVAAGAVLTAFERQARDVRVRLAGNEAAPTLETGVFAQVLLPTRSRSLGLDAALAEPVDTARAQAMLEDLLAEKPAFALGWQSLAQMRRLNGEPVAASLRALRMSALFGPAEGMAMMQRAVMGLEAWTSLAPRTGGSSFETSTEAPAMTPSSSSGRSCATRSTGSIRRFAATSATNWSGNSRQPHRDAEARDHVTALRSDAGIVGAARRERATTATSPHGTRLGTFAGPEGALTVALMAAMAWTTLADAGRSAQSWGLNAVVFGILVVAREVLSLRSDARPGVAMRRLLLPGALFLLALAWCLAGLAPVPAPFAHPAWGLAQDLLGRELPGAISLDPEATILATLRLATIGCAFWVATHLAAEPRRAAAILSMFVFVVVAHAAAGLIAAATAQAGSQDPLALVQAREMAGTFGNRNTFATMAGMALVAAVALSWRSSRRVLDRAGWSLKVAARGLGVRGLAGALCLGGAIVILAAALLLTGSRGAVLATGFGFLVFGGLMMRRRRSRASWPGMVVSVALGAAVAFAAFLVFGDFLASRFAAGGLADPGRVFAARTTVLAILSSPWLGYGFGTFSTVFPMFNDGSAGVWIAWDSPHNAYLELALELGVPGAALLIASMATVVLACARGARVREREAALPAAAAAVSALVALHAAVDFSLQSQGVALTFAMIVGAGFAQAVRPTRPGAAAGRRDLASGGAVVTKAVRF